MGAASAPKAARCVIMRGGTSKAVVFAAADLPDDPGARDRWILAAFGSPDPRQVDGLGGADPLTSKTAIVARSTRADHDIDYTFGQVGITSPAVNYAVTCGNTAAAVALYAAQEQLVAPTNGTTSVRINCTNNGKEIHATVPTAPGMLGPQTAGPAHSEATIRLTFTDPGGGDTGQLLPTAMPINEVRTGRGTRVRFSLVDCGNLYAIVPAATWSLTGSESPLELDCALSFRDDVEEIREAIAEQFLVDDGRHLPQGRRAARLKVAIVGASPNGPATDGSPGSMAADIVARIVNPERVHKAFAVTGAMCLAAAAAIPGTVVAELLSRPLPAGRRAFRIGHPQGVIAPEIVVMQGKCLPAIQSIAIDRTARRIMDGFVYLPNERS